MSRERELLQKVRDTLRGLKGTYYDLYWDIQTVLAEPEQKPLTLQQIIEGNPSMLNVTREIFINGVQFAEKMHGIGGGEC